MANYIALIGKSSSGKDVFSDYALNKYKVPSIRFSTVIGEIGHRKRPNKEK